MWLLMKNNKKKYFDHAFLADFVIVYMKMMINFPTFLLDIFLDYHILNQRAYKTVPPTYLGVFT